MAQPKIKQLLAKQKRIEKECAARLHEIAEEIRVERLQSEGWPSEFIEKGGDVELTIHPRYLALENIPENKWHYARVTLNGRSAIIPVDPETDSPSSEDREKIAAYLLAKCQ